MKLYKGDGFYIESCKSPDKITAFAISELTKYLSIAGLSPKDGGHKFCALQSDKLSDEGFEIEITDTCVTVLGNGRGVLYGVYELLERYFGFCFASYIEIFPEADLFELPDGVYTKQGADLGYRTAIVQFSVWAGDADRALTLPFIDWLAKNRYNRVLTWVSVYEQLKALGYLPELEKRGISLTVGHHQSIYTFLPPERYRKTHPEFFKLLSDGTRFNPSDYGGQLVLCCRNEQCIDTFAQNVISWLKDNPAVDTVAVWPNDFSEDACVCDMCKNHTKMENYIYFENEVAKRVGKVMPSIKIDMLIYSDLWHCPEGAKLCDNILIDQAFWSKEGLRSCGKKDGSCVIGTSYSDNMEKFCRVCKNTVFYDYYMGNYNARQRIMPAADEMQSIFRYCTEKGIGGSGTQMECFNLWNNIFNFYCFARTQYDTSLSMTDNLTAFCRLFGEGAEDISKIITLLEDTVDGQESIRRAGIYCIQNVDTDAVYALFDAALSKATGTCCRNNIRMLRLAFRYSHLITVDKSEDPSTEPKLPTYIDETGELSFMSACLDSSENKASLTGISLRIKNKSHTPVNDIWYNFE